MKECFIVPQNPLLSLLCRQPSPTDELKETRTSSSAEEVSSHDT
jgi:hypothetical protein